MGNIGMWEIFWVFLIVILLFGGRKIPEIAKGLGKGIRDFKSALGGQDDEPKKDETKALPAKEKSLS